MKKMQKKWIISSVSLLLAIVLGVTVFQEISHPAPPTQAVEQVQAEPELLIRYIFTADEIFTLVNQEREKVGIKPLIRDARLDASAAAKCNDIAVRQYWSHADPDGVMPWHFIQEAGYDYVTAGENLAKEYYSSAGMVSGWMSSQGHKANILNADFAEAGVSTCESTINGAGIAVQHYATHR